LIAAIALTACTTFRPIDPDQSFRLSLREGLLVLDIDTEISLEIARTSLGRLEDVEKGRHVRIFRVSSGRHSWREIRIDAPGPGRAYYRYMIDRDPEFEFEIEAGKLNYPGQFVVRRYRGPSRFSNTLLIRNVNRAGMTLRALRKSFSSILQKFKLVYAGESEDGFLEHYSRVVEELAKAVPDVEEGHEP